LSDRVCLISNDHSGESTNSVSADILPKKKPGIAGLFLCYYLTLKP